MLALPYPKTGSYINEMKQALVRFLVFALIAVLVSAPFYAGAYYQSLAISTFILIVLGVSWNIMAGFAGIFSFGQAAFFGIGAYVNEILILQGVHYSAALILSSVVGMLCGIVFVPCFRSRGLYFAILTLSLASAVGIVAGRAFPGQNSGLFASIPFSTTSVKPYFIALVGVVLAVSISIYVRQSKLGKKLAAIRDDPLAAAAVGVNLLRCRTIATLLGALLASLSGALYGLTQGYVDPGTVFGVNYSLLPVLATVLGGTGTIFGPVIGGFLWSLVDEVIRGYTTNSGLGVLIYGAVLMFLSLYFPKGILFGIERGAQRIRNRLGVVPTSLRDDSIGGHR